MNKPLNLWITPQLDEINSSLNETRSIQLEQMGRGSAGSCKRDDYRAIEGEMFSPDLGAGTKQRSDHATQGVNRG